MKEVKEYIQEIRRLSQDEQDPVVREFFGTLTSPPVIRQTRQIVKQICERRDKLSTGHLPYLLFISIQYLTDFKYDKCHSKRETRRDLAHYESDLVTLCCERNASTNVVSRYAHLQVAIEILNENVSILDVGTSMGLGLMSLNTEYVTNINSSPRVAQYLTGAADIDRRIGIDTQPRDTQWMLACYLPEQREERRLAAQRYRELSTQTEVEFHQLGLFDLPSDVIPSVDIIWTSSMRYQIDVDENTIEGILTPQLTERGLWLDASYRDPTLSFTSSDNPYVIRARSRNLDSPLEILQSPQDTAQTISKGRDFDQFLAIFGAEQI